MSDLIYAVHTVMVRSSLDLILDVFERYSTSSGAIPLCGTRLERHDVFSSLEIRLVVICMMKADMTTNTHSNKPGLGLGSPPNKRMYPDALYVRLTPRRC